MRVRLSGGTGCVALLGILVGPGLVAAHVTHSSIWGFLWPIAVVAMALGIAALPFKRKVTADEFADELERHLLGMDSDDGWDQVTSVRIFNPLLEEVRQSLSDRFDSLSTPEDREELQHIIEALRRGEFLGEVADHAKKTSTLRGHLDP